MSARTHSRQRSLTGQKPMHPLPHIYKGKETAPTTFEPCAATGSLFLYAEGSTVICLHHDTLALERKFEKHTDDIQFICVDNVSERGQGRLVVTYDIGRTAIVWDVMTGDQIARFASYEPLTAAAWMRNGNLTFGNEKGELILFEPATSDHVSARTIFDPVTAIAPAADCRTFAIGYRNGSILLAALQPAFTILHTLSTSRAPSQISALSWHASSSKQKSDMLATNTVDGDLRVWSVSKPPGSSQPRVIRSLHRSDAFAPSKSWITWSRNGRILQLYEGVTWSWDVRTKDVTYQPIPTVEHIRGIAAHGPTGTLFTLGPDHTIQQYDVDVPQMVANVRHPPYGVPQTPPQGIFPSAVESGSENEFMSPRRELRYGQSATPQSAHKRSHSHGSQPPDPRMYDLASPAAKTEKTGTSISMGVQSQLRNQVYSPVSNKTGRKQSKAKPGLTMDPQEKSYPELLPFTRARLSDVPYQQPRNMDDGNFTSDDLRKQMLNVVFGWHGDIKSLISDELNRHPTDTPNAVYLARWLGVDSSRVVNIFKTPSSDTGLNWTRLALNSIGNDPGSKKMAQVLVQNLLTQGDIHAAACLLMSIGEYNDAIEVYVCRNFLMEAVLLACLLMPSDWQRQSHLVRKLGEHAVVSSQQHLAVRCFSCINVEPTDPWTSPTAHNATQNMQESPPRLQPSIYHKTMERRGVQDSSPQTLQMPNSKTAFVEASQAAPTSQDGGLKLITSFNSKDDYRFPGLMSEEGTPINQAFVTPIVDSALPRSALSPGGYRSNNVRGLGNSIAPRTITPGASHKVRLPSIGEATADVETPQFPSTLVPRPPPTPGDSGSDREKAKSVQASQDNHSAQAQPALLLTPARYEPIASGTTPQTAVASQSNMTFAENEKPESENPAPARPRGSSRSRKPDGLSVSTTATHVSQSSQELLLPAVYGEGIRRPATASSTFSGPRGELSPPNTGNSLSSFRSAKSPVSIRSLDQYISSLEQAQYYKPTRSRGNSITSKQSKEEAHEKKFRRITRDYDNNRSRSNSIPVSTTKRSPSSPVPMSPGEIRKHTASTDSGNAAYSSNASLTNQQDTEVSAEDGNTNYQEDQTSHEIYQRHRSRSQAEGKSYKGSRASSRRRSPDRETGRRGRSTSRKEGSSTRSPESPVPMIPSEEDLQATQRSDPALKFVTQNRQRLHHSATRRDSSSDRRTNRMRSRSRQPEPIDTGLARKNSLTMKEERSGGQYYVPDPRQVESAGIGIERLSSASEAERIGLRNLQHLPYRRRKELAQAELEARRLSLTRRPSAPAVPLPGQSSTSSTPLSEYPPPLSRAQTDQGPITLSSFGLPNPPRPDSAGLGRSRPQTPRAMKHPSHGQKSVPDIPKLADIINNPPPPIDTSRFSPRKGRSSSFTSPEIPFDMPKHPMFDAKIATSRPATQDILSRNMSPPIPPPPRGLSREGRPLPETRNDFPVVTIGEEDYSEAEIVIASPPIVPELQHLAMPPPPPPPPAPPQELQEQDLGSGLRIQTQDLYADIYTQLPQSTYSAEPTSAVSPFEPNRRDRGVPDKQFVGKFRHLAGRMRSTSRGRSQSHGRADNPTRSPNLAGDEATSPYESLSQNTQPAQFHLATVNEGRW